MLHIHCLSHGVSNVRRDHPHGHCGPSPRPFPLSLFRSTTCRTAGLQRGSLIRQPAHRLCCRRHGVKQTHTNTPPVVVAGAPPATHKYRFEPSSCIVEGNPLLYTSFPFFFPLFFLLRLFLCYILRSSVQRARIGLSVLSIEIHAGRGVFIYLVIMPSTSQDEAQVPVPRKRCPPTALRINTPQHNPLIVLSTDDTSSHSTLSSPTSEHLKCPLQKPRSSRNMKKLSINLPSADSSTNSLLSPPQSALDLHPFPTPALRRPSILSLPNTTVAPALHRKDEDGSPTVPYLDGPIQVLPGIWLGSEDNARDWPALIQRRIKAILNVAKEVNSPFDASHPQPLRQSASTPNLSARAREPESTYYPPHSPTGRPGIHYLKLQWSHGERHLVSEGFPAAMAFVDAALARNEGVLIHCQCGVSRSATLMIAIVMRAAATRCSFVPPEVWELRGMQAAYSFVKEKSKHVGPNMSLIYQLLDYEKVLQGGNASPTRSDKSSSTSDEEKEWGRRRDAFAAEGYEDRDNDAIQQEAKDLDRAMEERIIARRPSAASTRSEIGLSSTQKSLNERKRAGSVASIRTSCGSVLSENLVEADEEAELLGVGGGFDDTTEPRRSPSLSSESPGSPSESDSRLPLTFNNFPARPLPVRRHLMSAPSASPTKLTFHVTRQSVVRASANIAPSRARRRPLTLGVLPPVPPSPVTPVLAPVGDPPSRPRRKRSSRKHVPPSLKLPDTSNQVTFPSKTTPRTLLSATQTLFVFPPSPTVTTATRTPATMTVTSSVQPNAYPFPSQVTPRVAMASSRGRTISFIGVGSSAAPTTAHSRVDARGWVGLE